MNTENEHSIDAVACPATQALNMMNNEATSFLPHNSLALSDRVADKLSLEMKAFHLSEAEGNTSTTEPSTSKCPLGSVTDALGESTIVSPSSSHTSLQKCRFSGGLSCSMDSFDLSGLARATEPVEASVAFPVIEWASDDEDEHCGENIDDDKSFLASRSFTQSDARFSDEEEDEDDDSTPVLFRPGSALSSSGMRKRCSDDISSQSSGMHRTKSRRSCLNSLSAVGNGAMLTANVMASPCSSPLFGDVSYQEDTSSLTFPPSHTAPSHGCSSWGQFIQPGTDEVDGSVPVLFAVTLTPTASNRKGGLKPVRRVSRSYRSS